MKSEALARGLAKMKHGFRKHGPEIYTGAGIIFGIGALVMGVIGTIKATKKVEEVKEEVQEDKLPVKEVVKHTWPYYIPAIALEAASITCMVGSNSASRKAIGALSTAYSLSESAFKRYKEKVVESLGEKKEAEIHDAVLDDVVKGNPPKTTNIIETVHGTTLCFDSITGQYFTSSIPYIKEVINTINHRMLTNGDDYATFNEWAYELGIEESWIGEQLGWNVNRQLMDVYFSAKVTQDGQPCVVLDYAVPPIYHYMDL